MYRVQKSALGRIQTNISKSAQIPVHGCNFPAFILWKLPKMLKKGSSEIQCELFSACHSEMLRQLLCSPYGSPLGRLIWFHIKLSWVPKLEDFKLLPLLTDEPSNGIPACSTAFDACCAGDDSFMTAWFTQRQLLSDVPFCFNECCSFLMDERSYFREWLFPLVCIEYSGGI